ncbi:MAG TPA: hypothetical protein VNN55_12545 [bacterium]|nr:hypothetical protein [bacterium]
MRKTKRSQRSRLIRKWDGTPVADSTIPEPEPPLAPEPARMPKPRREQLFFEPDYEDEIAGAAGH